MNIREFIEELESIAESEGDEIEVRLAFQPEWPFEYNVRSIEFVENPASSEDEDDEIDNEENRGVVYIVEAGQIGYLPSGAAREIGWSNR